MKIVLRHISQFIVVALLGLVWKPGSAQLMSFAFNLEDNLNDERVLNLDKVYHRRCRKWSQVPGIDKVKWYKYLDSYEDKHSYARARLGDIEYILDDWDSELPDDGSVAKYISTRDPKFECGGYHVGDIVNLDSIQATGQRSIKRLNNDNVVKKRIGPWGRWKLIVRNDTIIMFSRSCERLTETNVPKFMIDHVMLANWTHTSTLSYGEREPIDSVRADSIRNAWSIWEKRYEDEIRRAKRKNPYRDIMILCFNPRRHHRSTSIQTKQAYRKLGFRRLILDNYIEADSVPVDLNDDIRKIDEVQNIGMAQKKSYVCLHTGETITNPYITATLRGIEYLLMLDTDTIRTDAGKIEKYNYICKFVTYDPSFELKGYRVGSEPPSLASMDEQCYDLTSYSFWPSEWKCVAKGNKIICFYKYYDPWNSNTLSKTCSIDPFMLSQNKKRKP